MACRFDRRRFLGQSVAAGAAFVAVRSLEEKKLLTMLQNPSDEERLKEGSHEKMPMGKGGDLKISRIICRRTYHQFHLENFFHAIRGRARLNCPADTAFAATVAALKINEAVEKQATVELNAQDSTA